MVTPPPCTNKRCAREKTTMVTTFLFVWLLLSRNEMCKYQTKE